MNDRKELFTLFKHSIVNSSPYIVKYEEAFLNAQDSTFNLIMEFCIV